MQTAGDGMTVQPHLKIQYHIMQPAVIRQSGVLPLKPHPRAPRLPCTAVQISIHLRIREDWLWLYLQASSSHVVLPIKPHPRRAAVCVTVPVYSHLALF